MPAVDPHIEAVVELQRQLQGADLLRVLDRELFAEVNRGVAVAHVAQRGLHEVLSVADRCSPGQPAALGEVRLTPGGTRIRCLLGALEIFPNAALSYERVGFGRDVAADGRSPVVAVVVVEVRVNQLDRITWRIANDWPRKSQTKAHTVNQLTGGVAQLDPFAVVIQFAQPRAKRQDTELDLELPWVVRHHGVTAAVKLAAFRECERDSVSDHPAAEVNRLYTGVVQFDKLGQLSFDVGIVVDFINHHRSPDQGD